MAQNPKLGNEEFLAAARLKDIQIAEGAALQAGCRLETSNYETSYDTAKKRAFLSHYWLLRDALFHYIILIPPFSDVYARATQFICSLSVNGKYPDTLPPTHPNCTLLQKQCA
ncbi:UNVERIFIED_CONTAM: hypothetical protein ABIC26_004947 [Paenibacillus sp. PvR008]